MNKKILLVFTLVTVLVMSTIPSFVSAAPPEKIKVIVGFNGPMQPDLIRAYGGDIEHEIGIANAIATTLPQRAIEALENNPYVDYVEIDQKFYILEDTLPWGVDRIDAEIVWGGSEDAESVTVTGNAGAGINVMILDTGIDYTHPDLDQNYAGGYDFANGDDDPLDDNGHGTHCSGIVGAEDNGDGVIGVAPYVKLWAVKVLDKRGSGWASDIVAGIDWAVNKGAEVISMSLGGGSSSIMEISCDNAYASGVVVVAAAGNDEANSVSYPAAYSSVIAVSATDINDNLASFSNYGSEIELAAPGVNIYSTMPTYDVELTSSGPPWSRYNKNYDELSGTSMACPHVAGVAALVIASGVTNNVEARNKMTSTAEDLGVSGRDTLYGYGLVDAEAAVVGGSPPDKHDVAITSISAPSPVLIGDTANIDVTVANEGTHAETTTVTLTDTYNGIVIGSQDVTLSAGGSTIVTFTWDTTGEVLGDHVLEATASVVIGETETADNSMTTTVNVYEQGTGGMYVSDISWSVKKAGPNNFLYHTVTVKEESGALVSGATVYSTLTSNVGGPWYFSGTTDANGQVKFTLKKASSGDYKAEVTDITHSISIYVYNLSMDVDNPDYYTLT